MAVLGRLRNWRVCTRSLYTASLFLSPFTSLFDFFPFWFPPFSTLSAVALVAPSFFTGRRRLVPFSVVATYVPPASYVFSSSLTRCVASPIAFSYCHSPPFTQSFTAREYVFAIREGETQSRFVETALRRGSFAASRSDYARLFPLALIQLLVTPHFRRSTIVTRINNSHAFAYFYQNYC